MITIIRWRRQNRATNRADNSHASVASVAMAAVAATAMPIAGAAGLTAKELMATVMSAGGGMIGLGIKIFLFGFAGLGAVLFGKYIWNAVKNRSASASGGVSEVKATA